MVKMYYFDESGNTGDLALAAPGFGFGGQPLVVLACVGTDAPDDLAREISRLRQVHKVQSAELKFASIRRKPGFAMDLVAYIAASDLPLFVEVTDKRYAICVQMVETLIVPPVGPNENTGTAAFVKNVFSDRLHESAPNRVLEAFVIACREGTHVCTHAAFQSLTQWLDAAEPDDVVNGLRLFSHDTYQDFKDAAMPLQTFRPMPDRARSGKQVWMLPHVPSLLHIYGRINRSLARDLRGVRFIHDEQMQFDVALKDGMELAEGPVGKTVQNHKLADFGIDIPASLEFVVSDDHVGVQVADLLAGILSNCVRPFSARVEADDRKWLAVLGALLNLTDPARSRGINFVVPGSMHREIVRAAMNAAG
jgi:hypothetical protein